MSTVEKNIRECRESKSKQEEKDVCKEPNMYVVMLKAFISVVLPSCAIIYIVYMGFFNSVYTEIGTKYYAERPAIGLKTLLPKWIKMPLNSVINFGYVIMGAYWCAYTSAAYGAKRINHIDAYVSYVFNFMAGCYGPIQLLRILTQLHSFAVMDQWFTLPFFMWVFVWGYYLSNDWNYVFVLWCMIFSIGSYTLALYVNFGFEITLAVHILIAIVGAILSYKKYPCQDCKYPFLMSVICCFGFVGLKLIDLDLPKFHPVFTKISGHFLSKIADIFQIHYVNQFFFALTFYKHDIDSKKNT